MAIYAALVYDQHWIQNPDLSIHVTFTAIVPEAYPGEAKMCLIRLIAETDARSVGDITILQLVSVRT